MGQTTHTLCFTALLVLSLAACSLAPVQEMSDARLAIRSAEEANNPQGISPQLAEAKALLQLAELRLKAGSYRDARRYAIDARDEAIRIRERLKAQYAIHRR